MKKAKKTGNTQRDYERAMAAEAMPEVRRLVAKFGRVAVARCVSKIRLRDKEAKKLDALKKQVAEMERGLR